MSRHTLLFVAGMAFMSVTVPWRRGTRAERSGTACKCDGRGARAVNDGAHYDGNRRTRQPHAFYSRHADEKSVDQ